MSDYKSIAELRKEYSNINYYISGLCELIKQLEKDNLDLRLTIDHLKNELEQNRKWTATVYDPKKSTYKELETKLAQAEELRKKDIDELWETRINPMNKRIEEYENALRLVQSMSDNDTIELKDLRNIIKDQQTIINYAAGYISACEQFRDKHPNDVVKWLFEGLK